MHLHKKHEWVEIVLWIGIILTLGVLGYSVWYHLFELSIASLAVLLAFVILLGYYKYLQVLAIRRKFVIAQESFTTLMLVYFSYAYFSAEKSLPGEKALNSTRRKFDEIYEKSRYHLTTPLVMTALKTFGQIKEIKNIIMDEVRNFSSLDGFNLDNAEKITKEVGNLAQKLGTLSDLVRQGFTSKKSMEDIMDEGESRPAAKSRRGKSRAKITNKQRTDTNS